MTARRRLAIFLLITFLLINFPILKATATDDPAIAYFPAFGLSGYAAVVSGNTLYASNRGMLVAYDLTSLELLSQQNIGSIERLTAVADRLYAFAYGGTVSIFDIREPIPLLLDTIVIKDLTTRPRQENSYGPLTPIDEDRFVALAYGNFYLVNERTKETEWKYETKSSVQGYQVLGNKIFYKDKYSAELVGIEIGGGQVFSTACQGFSNVVGGELYYISGTGQEINRLALDATGGVLTSTWLTGLNNASGLTVHNGQLFYNNNGRFYGCNLETKRVALYTDCNVYNPYWLGSSDYDFRAEIDGGVGEFRNGELTWTTGGEFSRPPMLQANAADAFVYGGNSGSRVFTKTTNALETRQLRLGESHVWFFDHLEQSPVNLNISAQCDSPATYAQVELHLMHPGEDKWRLWTEAELDLQKGLALIGHFGPCTVMLAVTAAANVDWDPSDYAEYQVPVTYQVSFGDSLQPANGTPPKLSVSKPWPVLELWGNQQGRITTDVQLATEPYQWVYFLNQEEPAQADAKGNLTLTLPLEKGLLSVLQAVAADGDQVSLVTIPVVRHWAVQQPGESPLLSRSPALVVKVPDAAALSLLHCEMYADEIPIPLYVDLKNNTIYGVPNQSLPTGRLAITLVLAGKSDDPSGEPIWLDVVDWRQEIIGNRTAYLWPGKATASINGETLRLEAAPYIHAASSSTMLPFRFVADVMGAQVGWNAKTRQVTFKLDDRTVVLTIGSRTAKVNGKSVAMATAPAIVNGRTMVPLRFVSESLGAFVHWQNAERKVTIKVDGKPMKW